MAKKSSTPKLKEPLTKKLSDKLKKAGAKGELYSKLVGRPARADLVEALTELERDGLVVRLTVPGDAYCFAHEFTPPPVEEYLRGACEARGTKIWQEKDILGKQLPKYYPGHEVSRALQTLCAGPDVLVLQDGRSTKYLYLPGGSTVPSSSYFVSETARLIYALVELDGENQQRALGLTPTHYRDAAKAKEWYRGIAKIVHPDHSHHSKAEDAMGELDRIYRRMVGDA